MFRDSDIVSQERDKVSSSKFEVFTGKAKFESMALLFFNFLKALHTSFFVMVLMNCPSISHMEVIVLKTQILCLLAGLVHQDCTQYTALIVVAHIKGWSYLSDYEGIID